MSLLLRSFSGEQKNFSFKGFLKISFHWGAKSENENTFYFILIFHRKYILSIK